MNEKAPKPLDAIEPQQPRLEKNDRLNVLKGTETVEILKSFLLKDRLDNDEAFEADPLIYHKHKDAVGKIDGALAELSDFKIEHQNIGTNKNNFSADEFALELEVCDDKLKEQAKALKFGTEEQIKLADRRAAINYLLDRYRTLIKGPQEDIRYSVSLVSERQKAGRDWANQMRQSHNDRLQAIEDAKNASNKSKTSIDQKFTNPRQSHEVVVNPQKETVPHFSDKAQILEKEKQALFMEIISAAKGQTRIHTDIPSVDPLNYVGGSHEPRSGFGSFGDGVEQENSFYSEKLQNRDSAEAFLLEEDMRTLYKTITETITTKGLFRSKSEQVERKVAAGEEPNMIINPVTGKQEPAVKVAYQFDSNSDPNYKGPKYGTQSGRPGNMLFVEATLPKSIAEKLRQEILRDPDVARKFAKTLVLNNGITGESWNRAVRPPYDQLPHDWNLVIADLRKDGGRHVVISKQSIKVS